MSTLVSTAEPIASRSKITRFFALLVGFAVLCFGVLIGGVQPAYAAGHTVSGKIVFPTSAPANVRQVVDVDEDYETRAGVYLTVYDVIPNSDGSSKGWELGKDANITYNPSSGDWSVADLPNGEYRLAINAWLPGGGNAPGVSEKFTVNNADVVIDTVSITESGRLRAAIGLCGWEQDDQVEHFIKNTATNIVYQLESAQSGDSTPLPLCAPSPSTGIGNWMIPASGIAAGNYIAYTVWNGNTHYYTDTESLASANINDAGIFAVQLWVGRSIMSVVPQQVSSGALTLSGTSTVGETLTADASGWTSGTTFSYQWLRGTTPINGATSKAYVLTPADAGHQVAVRATGKKTNHEPKTVTSAAKTVAAAEFTAAPEPTISGTPKLGNTLTAQIAAWAPVAEDFSYQWLRNDQPIGGATAATYDLSASDVDRQISVRVTGSKAGYDPKTVKSAAKTIEAAEFTSTPAPTISGTAQVGSTLTAKPGTWKPAASKYTYQWLRDGKVLSGATKSKLVLTKADVGAQFSVTVTGTKIGYKTKSNTSAKTAKVVKAAYDAPDESPFNDVKTNYKFYEPIAWMFTEGLSTGVKTSSGRDYQPKVGVSREAMAAFLYRLEGAKDKGPKKSPFADVKPGDKFYNEIAWMYKTGLSTGVKQQSGKPNYAPKAKVSREAMAAFIYRLEEATTKAPKVSPFGDMNSGDKFYKEISWMGTEGLSTGIRQPSGKPFYAPKASVSREAMAAFLFRLETR